MIVCLSFVLTGCEMVSSLLSDALEECQKEKATEAVPTLLSDVARQEAKAPILEIENI